MTVTATAISPANATAVYQINLNGLVQGIRNGVTATEGTWLLGGLNSDFEVMASLTSGALDGGSALDTWLVCSSTRAWTRQRTSDASGTSSATLNVQMRDVATHTVLDTATITLEAVVDL